MSKEQFKNKIAAFRKDNMEKMQTAIQSNDTVTVNTLKNGFTKLQEELNLYNSNFAEKIQKHLSVFWC